MEANHRLAKHRKGDPRVARRTLAPDAEARLIAEAEASRDDDATTLVRSETRVASDFSAVLSVRLPAEHIRAIRELARERNQSLSELIQAAVVGLISAPRPSVEVGGSTRRSWIVRGGGPATTHPASGATLHASEHAPQQT